MISFNVPPFVGTELNYMKEAIDNHKICGDGVFAYRCKKWLEDYFDSTKVLLTTSCTHALEMAAILSEIGPGDEVIMPSFTFVSTADAFVLRGARVVFVDVRPDTMNIDESLIENAITKHTKAIVPVHYAGVACEMDKILEIANAYNLAVIEDAAQAIGSTYKGFLCGTMGRFGCFSFHETKNISMGEGGALLIKNKQDVERAEIVREKGTNRSKFFRGEVDKYTWVDVGSSYLPSELNNAYLWAQLEQYEKIQNSRMNVWKHYYSGLYSLSTKRKIDIPKIPKDCVHNAHMFYIKVRDLEERNSLIQYLKDNGVNAVFHYVPLHSAPAGKKYGRFNGEDIYTTKESDRLLRLPLYYNMKDEDVEIVIDLVNKYFN